MDQILFIIHHVVDFGIVSSFWLLKIIIHVQVFMWTYVLSQGDFRVEIAGSYGKYKLNF